MGSADTDIGRILLDTNVLSELMRLKPDKAVLAWFGRQSHATFYVSAITRAEILLGIALLPSGKRRDNLATAAEAMFANEFAGTSLAFDDDCAAEYALLVARRNHMGLPISTEDGQIAAIALVKKLILATRDVKDFKEIPGLSLANPWA